MTHYHEVYFNGHTNDGPRVGATRRTKAEIEREQAADRHAGRYVHPGAAIVRCDRPDNKCPWTIDGVPNDPPPAKPASWLSGIGRDTYLRGSNG